MTSPNPPAPVAPAAVAAPPELRVDANRVINHLKQRLTEEIAKAVVLEVALAESQERERALAHQVTQMQLAQREPAD